MDKVVHHYRITAKIGEGGMGEVFVAQDTKLNRQVALKLLSNTIAGDASSRRRFLAEAQAASALTHPNVCTIYEVGETVDGRPYIAMEYLRGRTLAEISRHQRLPIPQIVSIAAQIGDALDSAYELRIVHRDIKPSNVTLNDRGQVKVLDFGLAKRFGEADGLEGEAETIMETKSGHLVGTPGYMSPEQALGAKIDHRSDIFSLGVLIYELVAGRRPFAGANLGDTINRIVHHHPEPLAKILPELPAEFERIVMKCLDKEASRRYQTPRDLVLDLQNLLRLNSGPDPSPALGGIQSLPPPHSGHGTDEAAAAAPELTPSDVFISYAAVDDKHFTSDQAGWVTQFHCDLEVRVEQLFGEPARITRHPNPAGSLPEEARLKEVLPDAKAFICVLSPPFLKSPGCRRDLELFYSFAEKSGTLRIDDRSRMLKVLRRPVDTSEFHVPIPEILPRLPAFEFYETDPVSGRLLEYDDALGPIAKQRYHERIYDLAHEVWQVLKSVRRMHDSKAAGSGETKAMKTIFLAEATADLRVERHKLRREMTERGHQVVPNAALPMEAAELKAELARLLTQADATVHLVGSRYGVIPEGAEISLVEIQLQMAQLHGKSIPHLVWMPATLDVQDARQGALINRLRNDSELHDKGEVIQGTLNLLKDLLLRRIDPPPKTHLTPRSGTQAGPPRVYLICDAADEEEVAFLEDSLFDHGCEVSLPLFEGPSGEIAEAHRRKLQTCDAVLIYYGSTLSHWVETKLLDIAQAPGYGRSRQFKAHAVWVSPSDDRRKNRFRTHLADVLRPEAPSSAEALLPFLRKVQADEQATP